MTRELRQANKVWTPGKTQIYVNIGDDTHVLYDCDVVHPDDSAMRQCLRWEAAVGEELPLAAPARWWSSAGCPVTYSRTSRT